MSYDIDISGIDKADLLAALFNASRPLGMGFLDYKPEPMTHDHARGILEEMGPDPYFDYLQGRVMKVHLGGDMMRGNLYDRDNGPGAAQAVVDGLRAGRGIATPEIAESHARGVQEAAGAARRMMGQGMSIEDAPGMKIINLGLADVADLLGPKIDEATGS